MLAFDVLLPTFSTYPGLAVLMQFAFGLLGAMIGAKLALATINRERARARAMDGFGRSLTLYFHDKNVTAEAIEEFLKGMVLYLREKGVVIEGTFTRDGEKGLALSSVPKRDESGTEL